MKHLSLLLLCTLFLTACKTKQQQDKTVHLSFTQEEQEFAIEVLSYYLQVDTAYARKTEENFRQFNQSLNDGQDPELYARNIIRMDSVLKHAIQLVKKNKPSELLELLEKEKLNFYIHPSNTVELENELHGLFITIYRKSYTEEKEAEYFSKLIPLAERTKQHLQILRMFRGEYHPWYQQVLQKLMEMNVYANNWQKAIDTGKELYEYVKEFEDEQTRIYTTLLLSTVYDDANMPIQRDSCINSVKESPYFDELYQTVYGQ